MKVGNGHQKIGMDLVRKKNARPLAWADRAELFFGVFGDRLVWAMIALFVGVFGTLCVRKYLSYGYNDFDLANDVAVYWNSLHGRFAFNPFFQESSLGGHVYAFGLLILPIFALAPHAITVLLIQALFLALPAWPLYRLALERTKEATFATLVAVLYLVYPCVGIMALWEAHFDIFTILFFVLALLYFERERFWPFMLCLLLAVSAKENASFVVFMFGAYSFVRRRSWRWVLAPSILGFLWFLVAMKWVIPSFSTNAANYPGGYIFASNYRHFGDSMFEVIMNIFLHPVAAVKFCLAGHKLFYPVYLLAPTGGLFIFSPAVLLMALPIFAQNLLSLGPTHSSLQFHYTAMMIPFFFAAMIEGYRRLRTFSWSLHWRSFTWVFLIGISIFTGILLRGPQFFLPSHFAQTRITDLARAKDRWISQVPRDASVMVTFQFTPRLAPRRDICTNHLLSTGFMMNSNTPYVPPDHLQYAIFDFNDPLLLGAFWGPQSPGNIRRFLENGWGTADMLNDMAIFKKGDPGTGPLVSPAGQLTPQKEVRAVAGDFMELVGLDVTPALTRAGRVVRMAFYWKRTKAMPDIGVVLSLAGADGRDVAQQIHMVGYRIYPPSSWPQGDVMVEHYALYVPLEIQAGPARLKLAIFSAQDGSVIPLHLEGRPEMFNVLEINPVGIPYEVSGSQAY
jgi:uncharacterized membrane protein